MAARGDLTDPNGVPIPAAEVAPTNLITPCSAPGPPDRWVALPFRFLRGGPGCHVLGTNRLTEVSVQRELVLCSTIGLWTR
jgi:hypothetical protein